MLAAACACGLCACTAVLGLSVVPARAAITHRYLSQIAGAPDVTTGLAWDLKQTSAKLGGRVDPLDAGEANQDQPLATPGPGIEEESAFEVASTSATLSARVDPHGAATSCYFQYGTSREYGSEPPAPPGEPIGSGEGEVEIDPRHLQGLEAGTVYHYRVVLLSEVSTETSPGNFETKLESFYGPDQTFTTQLEGKFMLPDNRGWELVSPADKLGAAILPYGDEFGGEIQASADGDAIVYQANSPTEAVPHGYANDVAVLSTRGAQGWSSSDLVDPHNSATAASVGDGAEYRLFSSDLSTSIVQPFGAFEPSLSPEASEQTPFLRTDYLNRDVNQPCANSCLRPLVTGAAGYANVPEGTVFGALQDGEPCPPALVCGPQLLGATPDLNHIVLSSSVPLTSGATGEGLYEWAAGKLTLVSVLPDGEPATGATLGFKNHVVARAISDDGSRVVFSAAGEGMQAHLYLREHATQPQSPIGPNGECTLAADACTLQLDAVQGGSGGNATNAAVAFEAASSDDSTVFFTDAQSLTADAGASSGVRDLYECEILEEASGPRCNLTDLTPAGPTGEGADVLGVIGASEDGSYVYFVAEGALAEGAVTGLDQECREGPDAPVATRCNLYVWHDGVTTLIALLAGEDYNDYLGSEKSLEHSVSAVSPNGRWLAFMSQLGLTGDDTNDAISGEPDQEVYLYDAEANRLVCASCNPSGGRPAGAEGDQSVFDGGRVFGTKWAAALIPTWESFSGAANNQTAYQSRYLSDSGRLFFDSIDALVPQDVNGTWDVYEYEPPAVGSCESSSATFSERSDGCIGLISSGEDPKESAFLDASETGGDVFFLTSAKLVSQDYDESVDVYDAHECTTLSPCLQPPPAPSGQCQSSQACRPELSPQPAVSGAPSSATFSGAGNLAPAPRPKSLTRAQKLARALKACHPKRGRRRASCERSARERYGTQKIHKRKGSR